MDSQQGDILQTSIHEYTGPTLIVQLDGPIPPEKTLQLMAKDVLSKPYKREKNKFEIQTKKQANDIPMEVFEILFGFPVTQEYLDSIKTEPKPKEKPAKANEEKVDH